MKRLTALFWVLSGLPALRKGAFDSVGTFYYQLLGMKARAFVGCTGNTGQINEDLLIQYRYAGSFVNFFDLWLAGYPLNQCLYSATNAPGPGENRLPLQTDPSTNAFGTIRGAYDLQRFGP